MKRLLYPCLLLLATVIGTMSCEDDSEETIVNITMWNGITAPYEPISMEAMPSWFNTKSFSYPYSIKYVCEGTKDDNTIYLVHFSGSGVVYDRLVNGVKDAMFDAQGRALDILSFKALEEYKTKWKWTCIRIEGDYDVNESNIVSLSWNGKDIDAPYTPVSINALPSWLTAYQAPLYEVFKGSAGSLTIYKLVYLKDDGIDLGVVCLDENGKQYDEAELAKMESSWTWTCLFVGFAGEH